MVFVIYLSVIICYSFMFFYHLQVLQVEILACLQFQTCLSDQWHFIGISGRKFDIYIWLAFSDISGHYFMGFLSTQKSIYVVNQVNSVRSLICLKKKKQVKSNIKINCFSHFTILRIVYESQLLDISSKQMSWFIKFLNRHIELAYFVHIKEKLLHVRALKLDLFLSRNLILWKLKVATWNLLKSYSDCIYIAL